MSKRKPKPHQGKRGGTKGPSASDNERVSQPSAQPSPPGRLQGSPAIRLPKFSQPSEQPSLPKGNRGPLALDIGLGSAAVLGPFLLYFITMPRLVSLEDDGLFLLVGKFLGVGHPPGYPIHTLMSNLFLKLPFGTDAFLGHLLSGVFGALACGALYASARFLSLSPILALIGAWMFGVTEHYWAQAIITEVYTLNALFFFTIFALILYLKKNPENTKVWIITAAASGLSLSNHWPLMVLASPGLMLLILPLWKHLITHWWKLILAFIPTVSLPYAWMIFRSIQEPVFSFPGRLDTFRLASGHINRSGYRDVDTSATAGWSDRFEFFSWFTRDLIGLLTFVGFAFALVGLYVLLVDQHLGRKSNSRHRSRRGPSVWLEWLSGLATPLVFFSQSIALILLLTFDFDFQRIFVFRAYPSVAYGLFALWVVLGLNFVRIRWVSKRVPDNASQTIVVAGIGVALIIATVISNWSANNRADTDFAQRYSDMMFELLPPDAVLITVGDEIVLPLAYNLFVEKVRDDIRFAEVHGIMFPGNLYESVAYTPIEEQTESLKAYLEGTDRPVFHTYRSNRVDHGRGVRDYGFVREVLEGTNPEESIELLPHDAAAEYFRHLAQQRDLDGWERVARSHQMIDYGQFLGYILLSKNTDLIEETADLQALAAQDYYGLNGMAGVLGRFGDEGQIDQALEFLEVALPMRDEALTKQAEAEIYNNLGISYHRSGGKENCELALQYFGESREIANDPTNPGVDFLNQIAELEDPSLACGQ